MRLIIIFCFCFNYLLADTIPSLQQSTFELGFTPRFNYFKSYELSPTRGIDYYDFFSNSRLQLGFNIHRQNYIHAFFNYYMRRINYAPKGKNFDSYAIGLQYERKMMSEIIQCKAFYYHKKWRHIRFFPSMLFAIGFSNVNSNYLRNTINNSNQWNLNISSAGAVNFYVNRLIDIQILYQIELYHKIKYDPIRYFPMQAKLIYKI